MSVTLDHDDDDDSTTQKATKDSSSHNDPKKFIGELISKLDLLENAVKRIEKKDKDSQIKDDSDRRGKFKEYKNLDKTY